MLDGTQLNESPLLVPIGLCPFLKMPSCQHISFIGLIWQFGREWNHIDGVHNLDICPWNVCIKSSITPKLERITANHGWKCLNCMFGQAHADAPVTTYGCFHVVANWLRAQNIHLRQHHVRMCDARQKTDEFISNGLWSSSVCVQCACCRFWNRHSTCEIMASAHSTLNEMMAVWSKAIAAITST